MRLPPLIEAKAFFHIKSQGPFEFEVLRATLEQELKRQVTREELAVVIEFLLSSGLISIAHDMYQVTLRGRQL